MPVYNADISATFEEIADLLEIQGANVFRIRAYRNAARILGDLPQEARALMERGDDLTRLPGIGTDLAGKIGEILTTGHCSLLERLRRELPPAITELLKIPVLGPKRVKALYHELDVQTTAQLQRAARDGRIRALHGFGAKTEQNILQAVQAHASQDRRFMLATAAQYADTLCAFLQAIPGVQQVIVAGSFRRMRDTVGDLDILVTATPDSTVMQKFTSYDEVDEVYSAGATRASVLLKCGIQVDLRVVARQSYGAALHYFTGSRAHNIAIRRIAQQLGLKVNEYGVFRGGAQLDGIALIKGIEVNILEDGSLDLPDAALARLTGWKRPVCSTRDAACVAQAAEAHDVNLPMRAITTTITIRLPEKLPAGRP